MFYTADQLEVEMLKSTEFEMHGVPEWFHNRTKSPFQKQNTRFYLTHLCVLIEYCSITLPKIKISAGDNFTKCEKSENQA